MEAIKIPRFENRHDEHCVYQSVESFSELCDRLCLDHHKTGNSSTPTIILCKMLKLLNLPVPAVRDMFNTLRDAAFTYTPPPTLLPPKARQSLFSAPVLATLENQRSTLKNMTSEHSSLMKKLVDSQLGLKKELSERLCTHTANVNKYVTLVEKERSLRTNMIKISRSMEMKIKGCIQRRLAEACNKLQKATDPLKFWSDFDPMSVGCDIFEITAKRYTMFVPPEDTLSPTFNKKIIPPSMEDSSFCEMKHARFGNNESICKMKARVTSNGNVLPEKYLDLRIGDIFKVKVLSSDATVAFGYVKQRGVLNRKWGFVYTDQLALDRVSKP